MKHWILYFLLITSISCDTKEGDLYEINPLKFNDNEITLSDIADDISYISLDNSIVVGHVFKTEFTANYIYASTKGTGLVQFGRDGKFIRKIGQEGRGPGEYLNALTFTVNEFSGNIYVLDRYKLLVYSSSGTFLRNLELRGELNWRMDDIIIINSLLFFPDYNVSGSSKFDWVFVDTLGNQVAKKRNSVLPFSTNKGMAGKISKLKNKLLYFNYFNDTVFYISPDMTFKGAYVFAQGDFRLPKSRIEFGNSISENQAWLQTIFQIENMIETDSFLILVYGFRDQYAFAFIDKITGRTFLASRFMDELGYNKPWLKNDLDAGMPLTKPIKYYSDGEKEYLVSIVEPTEIKRYVQSPGFKEIVPKNTQQQNVFVKLEESLKETDNPILMMVRLKK